VRLLWLLGSEAGVTSRSTTMQRSPRYARDKLPAATLDYGFPPEKIDLVEHTKDKNVILMGLPGAFTPT